MDSSSPFSTRPGWERHVNGVAVGVSVGGSGVFVDVGSGVKVGGMDMRVGAGCVDGEQAKSPVRIARKSIIPVA